MPESEGPVQPPLPAPSVRRAPTQAATILPSPYEKLSVRANVIEHTPNPQRPHDLPALVQERARTASMLVASDWFGGALKAEGELAHSTSAGPSTMNDDPFGRRQLYRIGLTGAAGVFRYGVT
ncbi:MAG TPA: hypothetical protein VFA38_03580, partial [Nitrospirales bacterium]|nr:hypothetical protein [Nitrospirales bacterium]